MMETVPAHLSRLSRGRPSVLVLLGVFLWACAFAPAAFAASASAPYVETSPDTGFHLFLRPAYKNPTAQLVHVQNLVLARKFRAAARQARALRTFWPDSPEAPKAQFIAARLLDRRGSFMDAFDAYQILIENYPESCDYDAVCAAQLRLANNVYTSKLATCWGLLPGFSAPERAIPLYEKLLVSAPEGPSAPEAAYRIACAREANYDYAEAIDAFYQVLNRFPESPYAVDAALGQARCHIALADDAPLDARAREAAIAACDLVLSSQSAAIRRAPVEKDRRRLLARREEAAYERCLYYDRTLRDPAAALLEYRSFVALFPASDHLPAAQARIRALELKLPPDANPLLASSAPAETTPKPPKGPHMRSFLRLALPLLALLLLPGCANYRLGSMLPPDVRTVYVPTAVNRTTEPFIEQDATSAILSAIQMDGALRVTSQEDADSILDITLTQFWLDPVSYVSGETSTANEYRLNIRASIVLRRTADSSVILERSSIVGYDEFDFTGDLTSSKAIALRPAAEDLGRRIVDAIVQYWP